MNFNSECELYFSKKRSLKAKLIKINWQMLCMVWLSWYWEGRKGFSVIERDCYSARSSPSSLDLWSPHSGRKNPPTRETSLMPTGKVVTTVRQARVNHQVRFTNTRDRVIHYLCKWSDEAKINERDPLMNFYSDSILQIMTLYVRDTGKSQFTFWTLKSLWKVTVDMKLKDPCSLEEKQW